MLSGGLHAFFIPISQPSRISATAFFLQVSRVVVLMLSGGLHAFFIPISQPSRISATAFILFAPTPVVLPLLEKVLQQAPYTRLSSGLSCLSECSGLSVVFSF